MTTSQTPRTFAELYGDLIAMVRQDSAQSSIVVKAKRLIDTALQDMHLGTEYKFPWAERSGFLLTNPQYTTGTVAVTKGSTAVTGTSTLWTTTNDFGIANVRAGGKIVFDGDFTVYEVSSVGGATSLTLTAKFVGATDSEAGYTYFEDEHDLAYDFKRPVGARFFDANRSIVLLGRQQFREMFPRNATPGQPTAATIYDRPPSGNTTPRRRICLHRPPSTAEQIPYEYITSKLVVSSAGAAQESFSADADEPIVPFAYRRCIVYFALSQWYRDLKDDQRSQAAFSQYTDMMLRMQADTEIGFSRPQIRPVLGPYKSRAMRPWRGAVGRYDVNGRFDNFEV